MSMEAARALAMEKKLGGSSGGHADLGASRSDPADPLIWKFAPQDAAHRVPEVTAAALQSGEVGQPTEPQQQNPNRNSALATAQTELPFPPPYR
eukprot:7235469-Alexandrium_andersonii.AAC.1